MAKQAGRKTERKSLHVRVPPNVFQRIQKRAEKYKRSVSAEIEDLIEIAHSTLGRER